MRRTVALGELATRVCDRVPAGTGRGAFVGLEHLVAGQLRIDGRGRAAAQRSDAWAYRRGDVLFGALRPGFRKVALAAEDGVCSAEILVLRPRAAEHAGLVFAWVSHADVIAAAVARSSGTRMPRVSWEQLAGLRRALPDAEGRQRIGELAVLFDRRLALVHARDHADTALLRTATRAAARPGGGPRLADVAERRASYDSAHDVVIGVADLPSGGLAIHTWGDDPGRSQKRPVVAGDLLVSRLRPALRKVGVCPTDGCASPEIQAWNVDPGWRAIAVGRAADPAVQDAWIAAASGTRMPRIPGGMVAETRLGVAEADAPRLARALDPVVERLQRGVGLAAALRALRDRVLADLLDGRIDTGALPAVIDVPPLQTTGYPPPDAEHP